uniref:R3H-associated N-terminal domain-containing protein n=1 Tax=Dendroctonus ponderosae TaxID=77166 RepID=J3JUG9_DENPD|nr:unknown [Dendroctonus ponderosae]
MTVIADNKSRFEGDGSPQNSDTESLGLNSPMVSDTESLQDSVIIRPRPFQARSFKPILLDEYSPLKRSSGKRKLRRYENRLILQFQEDQRDEKLIVIVDPYKSPFARLLEDSNAMRFWNDFTKKSEEEQSSIICAFSQRQKHPLIEESAPNNVDAHVGRISTKVKRSIKTKKNLSIEAVRDSELDLLDFFKSKPQNVYVKSPSTSFDRLLLRAIATYHGLQIRSAVELEGSSKPQIKIFNDRKCWTPANCFLTDFIKQLKGN